MSSKETIEAILRIKDAIIMTMPLKRISSKILIPCMQYIEDPLEIKNIRIYNLVFELRESRKEKNKTIVTYVFKGVSET